MSVTAKHFMFVNYLRLIANRHVVLSWMQTRNERCGQKKKHKKSPQIVGLRPPMRSQIFSQNLHMYFRREDTLVSCY